MGKAPAFMFYVKDWLADPTLQMASSATRGIWINALCYMWESPDRGRITGNRLAMARMLMCNNGEFEHFLEEANQLHFCDVERQENVSHDEILTLINRRMVRETKELKLHRERQLRYEVKKKEKESDSKNDAKMTPPSSSSSPSPTPKNKTYTEVFLNFWDQYPNKKGKEEAFKAWRKHNPNMEVVIKAVNAQKEEKARLNQERKFCPEWPNASTWLNNKRWEDEIKEPKTEYYTHKENRDPIPELRDAIRKGWK